MKRIWVASALCATLCLAHAARAGAGAEPAHQQTPVPLMGSAFQFVPGTWGRYSLSNRVDGQAYMMRFSVLDEVRRRGAKSYWIEVEIFTNEQPVVVTRMLVPDTGRGPGEVQQAVVQVAGFPPFDVPRRHLRSDSPKADGQFLNYETAVPATESTLEWKGRTIKTQTISALKEQSAPARIVLSADAPPLCIVELDTAEAQMELLDWGTGAQSAITEKPTGLIRWLWRVIRQAATSSDQAAEPR